MSDVSDELKISVKQIPSLVPFSHLPVVAASPDFVRFAFVLGSVDEDEFRNK